ncbi:MAG TPA: DoxX family protein [Cyclobacteriaceae bacterium]|nr:DoxX family protein [Cyclobacteriaceae bacterium]
MSQSVNSLTNSLRIFRMIVPVFMLIHGITRITHQSVGGFGEFLSGNGFPFGFYIAWAITIFEIAGSILIIAGYLVPICSVLFALELTAGILMVHWANGWFVVGASTGGMEYSVLLILCFLLLALTSRRHR